MKLIDAYTLAAQLKIYLDVTQAVFRATAAMGWPKETARQAVFDAEVNSRTNSPIFVETIEVLGHATRKIENQHIGYTSYSTRNARTFNVVAMRLEAAKTVATQHLKDLAGEGSELCGSKNQHCFSPNQILLKDHFGRVIGMNKCGKWVKPISNDNLDALKGNEIESYRLALIATNEDNFAKAQALREMAQNLEWLYELSEAHNGGQLVF